MTPEARARFYKALYQAKCEQYDTVMREVDALLTDPGTLFTCDCGVYLQHGDFRQMLYLGRAHRRGQPCEPAQLEVS